MLETRGPSQPSCKKESIRVMGKVTQSAPRLSLGLLSPPYPLFQWYPQSKDILIKSQYEV
jgi:hypothetical protein